MAQPTIDPPPAELVQPCERPPDATAGTDLRDWVLEWIAAYWCARGRQQDLVRAWPQ